MDRSKGHQRTVQHSVNDRRRTIEADAASVEGVDRARRRAVALDSHSREVDAHLVDPEKVQIQTAAGVGVSIFV
jgi:hypothetical protein